MSARRPINQQLERTALSRRKREVEALGVDSRRMQRRDSLNSIGVAAQSVQLPQLMMPDLLEIGVVLVCRPFPFLDDQRFVIFREGFK